MNATTTDSGTAVADTALRYAAAGLAVFPARVEIIDGRKRVTPISEWRNTSTTDPKLIRLWFGPRGIWRDASLAIDCGKSALVVVDCDGAEGIAAWDALVGEHRIGATWRTATPGQGLHWYFRADPNTAVGNSAGRIAPKIDVRGVGGFVLAPPSADTRGRYHWLEGEPEWDQLPIVPHLVIDRANRRRPPDSTDRRPTGDANGRRFTLDQAYAFCRPHVENLRAARNGTINDTLNTAAMVLGHFVPDGFWTRQQAEVVLTEALSATVYDGKTWQAGATIESGLDAGERDWQARKVTPGGEAPPTPEPDTDGSPPASPTVALAGLPDTFWDARPVLTHIRRAAWARVQCPDVVLYTVLARMAALMHHQIKVDSGISTPASLNLFAALVGYSGDGKTQGVKVGAELMPAPDRKILDFDGQLPLGSGEGLAEAYQGLRELPAEGKKKPQKIKTQVRHNALFYVDEGQTFCRLLFDRTGSTTGAALRSAWGGEMIGQRNAQEVTTRIVAEGSYALGVIVAFQPTVVTQLLADGGTGMPQRFIWSVAADPNIPDERVGWPGPLPWNPATIREPVTIEMPATVKEQLYRDALARKRGQQVLAELDGQAPLMMVKLAALLALLDSRTEATEDDWALAQTVWDTSRAVRDALVAMAAQRRTREEDARDDRYVGRAVRQASAVTSAEKAIVRVARAIALRVHEADGGMTNGSAFRAMAGRDRDRGRDFFDAAVEHAAGQGWVHLGEHGLTPGRARPVD
jgi:hypothetical protein